MPPIAELNVILVVDDVENEPLTQGDSVFISPTETNFNLYKLLDVIKEKNIKVDFYIMNEPLVEKKIVDILLPYTNHMFLQNNI